MKMETINSKKVKANKIHTCNWCLLAIKKGAIYHRSFHSDEGDVYTWKNHIHCANIADEIGCWDNGDGLNQEDFQESVKCEYQRIMSNHFNSEYENKDFKYPSWESQLNFVLAFHKIESDKPQNNN